MKKKICLLLLLFLPFAANAQTCSGINTQTTKGNFEAQLKAKGFKYVQTLPTYGQTIYKGKYAEYPCELSIFSRSDNNKIVTIAIDIDLGSTDKNYDAYKNLLPQFKQKYPKIMNSPDMEYEWVSRYDDNHYNRYVMLRYNEPFGGKIGTVSIGYHTGVEYFVEVKANNDI